MADMPPIPLSDRFAEALIYAEKTHRTQARKGTTIPYVAHLMAVASLVLEDGGDEDLAVAALLHDAAEDQGGDEMLATIERHFGARVSGIVSELSDTTETPKPPWRARKEAYVAHLDTATDDAIRVTLADKVHNLRSIVSDYRTHGEALWTRFDKDSDQLWYYGALVDALGRRRPGPLADELARSFAELKALRGVD